MIVDKLLRVALLGSTWVLYLLIALSIVSITAILERVVFFRRHADGGTLRNAIVDALLARDLSRAEKVLATSASIEASVITAALRWKDGGAEPFADALESELARARADLERGSNLLGTLGNNAPFVGLLGTVIGVLDAFHHLGGSAARAGNMSHVMGGIAEALIATAVGIFVALPAVVAFNAVQKKIGDIENNAISLGKLFTAYLKSGRAVSHVAPSAARAVIASESVRTDTTDAPDSAARLALADAE